MNKRICKYFEQIYSHSYDRESVQFPLIVLSALYSRWGPGDGFSFYKKTHTSINCIALGNGTFEQNGRSGILLPGDIFIAHKGSTQKLCTGNAGFLHKRSIVIDGWMSDQLLDRMGLLEYDVVRPNIKGNSIGTFRTILSCMKEKTDNFTSLSSLLLYRLILELGQSGALQQPLPVRRVVDFIQRNISKPITLDTISSHVSLSTRQCCRLFAQSMHCSIQQFIIEQRLSIARDLITNSSHSIKEIGLRVGYTDQFHFSTQFKKHFKKSPKGYREAFSAPVT